ncbi:outer membrane protein romA [Algibacter lectus]|uniref:Outer membrane protein romA n=2 Tax=Algibacter lectus TaxID=221126 RepID=A0A090WC19_9FLAO|nr:outer membrane protein romA [Algibacter lectus]
MNTPRFGKHPSGKRLSRIEQSPNYKNGQFQNLSETPMLAEGVSYWSVLKEFLNSGQPKEPQNIPTKKTDLKSLSASENVIIWMGHSSYFMQLDGKKILVDPVMSGNASPVSFTTKAYKGSDVYTTEDIPDIDYLFITHDHWDHLDYKTILELKPKIKTVICGLGVGAHFERWGFDSSIVMEEDWYKTLYLDEGFVAHVTPARHFSGRGFKRNQTLWASFAFFTPSSKIFIGGDGGYDTHFTEIGEKYGPFDLAVLENGQYDKKWKYIHTMPGEPMKAASDLKTKTVLPVHSGKFTLGIMIGTNH